MTITPEIITELEDRQVRAQTEFLELARMLKLDPQTLPTPYYTTPNVRQVQLGLVNEMLYELQDHDELLKEVEKRAQNLRTCVTATHRYLYKIKQALNIMRNPDDFTGGRVELAHKRAGDSFDSIAYFSLRVPFYLIELQPFFSKADEIRREKELVAHVELAQKEADRPFDRQEQTSTAHLVGHIKKQLKKPKFSP